MASILRERLNKLSATLSALTDFINTVGSTIRNFDDEKTEVLEKVIKLYGEIDEIKDGIVKEAGERITSSSANTAERSEHLENLRCMFTGTVDKLFGFGKRISQFSDAIHHESAMWIQHGAPDRITEYLSMSDPEQRAAMEKWNARNQILNEWKTTATGFKTEWEQQLKLEIQESLRDILSQTEPLS